MAMIAAVMVSRPVLLYWAAILQGEKCVQNGPGGFSHLRCKMFIQINQGEKVPVGENGGKWPF